MISLNVNHKPQAFVQDTIHLPSLTSNLLCCGKILASKGHIHYETQAFLEVHTGIRVKSIRYVTEPRSPTGPNPAEHLCHRSRRTGHPVSPASSYSICTIIPATLLEAQNKSVCVSPPDPPYSLQGQQANLSPTQP